MANLAPNEDRPAATGAELLFTNTFTGAPATLPLQVPVVHAASSMAIAASTDAASYAANAPVLVSGVVTNGAGAIASASVRLSIVSPAGQELAEVGVFPIGSLAANASRTVSGLWNTGVQPAAANYAVRAQLFDDQGRPVSEAQARFAVVAGVSVAVTSRVTADKPSYAPNDTVALAERVVNTVANTTIADLSARTLVRNAGGGLVWSRTEPLAQLAAGVTKELSYAVALQSAAPGSYQVELTVLNASGASLSTSTTSFTVRDSSTTGDGLGGTLQASPKVVGSNEAVALDWHVSNQGNSAFASLPVRVRVLDAANPGGAAATELDRSLNLPVGQTQGLVQSWTPTATLTGKTLLAVLEAQVGGQWLNLARDSFSVASPAVQLSVQPQREARVLALVSCPPGSDGGPLDQVVSGGEASCASRRAGALDAALDSLGLVHKAVTSRAEFESELRCGIYNTYWISGGSNKLSDDVARELGEAIQRGDSLILEGSPDNRNQLLYPIAGVQANGTLSQADQTITFPGSADFPAGNLATLGRAGRYTLAGAQLQARFAQDPSAPALASAQWGNGHSLLIAFEFARMLEQSDPARLSLLGHLIDAARNTPAASPVGAPQALAISVSNSAAQATTAQVQASLAAGLDPLPGQPTSWNLNLAAGQTQTLVLRVKPRQSGDLGIDLSATTGGQTTTQHTSVQAQTPALLGAQALALTQALAPATPAGQSAKESAVNAITQAQTLSAAQREDEALSAWLQAAAAVQTLPSSDNAHLAIAQALQGSERALCTQLACLSGNVQIRQGEQVVSQLSLNANANSQRQVQNACPAPLPGWHISLQLTNQRTAQTLLQLDDDLALNAGQSDTRQGSFIAGANGGQAGDTLDALLYGQRNGWQWALGRTSARLAGALMCDADGNGVINSLDIVLISQAIGKSVPAGDVRDPDGNKLITVNDARACTARCTKANCAL